MNCPLRFAVWNLQTQNEIKGGCRFNASAESEDSNVAWSLLHPLIPHPVTFMNQTELSLHRLLRNRPSNVQRRSLRGQRKQGTLNLSCSNRANTAAVLQGTFRNTPPFQQLVPLAQSLLCQESGERARRTVAVGSLCKALAQRKCLEVTCRKFLDNDNNDHVDGLQEQKRSIT